MKLNLYRTTLVVVVTLFVVSLISRYAGVWGKTIIIWVFGVMVVGYSVILHQWWQERAREVDASVLVIGGFLGLAMFVAGLYYSPIWPAIESFLQLLLDRRTY